MSTSNLVLRTIYIRPEIDDKLRAEAFDMHTSKNDLIRRYLELGMKVAQKTGAAGSSKARTRAMPRKVASKRTATNKTPTTMRSRG